MKLSKTSLAHLREGDAVAVWDHNTNTYELGFIELKYSDKLRIEGSRTVFDANTGEGHKGYCDLCTIKEAQELTKELAQTVQHRGRFYPLVKVGQYQIAVIPDYTDDSHPVIMAMKGDDDTYLRYLVLSPELIDS